MFWILIVSVGLSICTGSPALAQWLRNYCSAFALWCFLQEALDPLANASRNIGVGGGDANIWPPFVAANLSANLFYSFLRQLYSAIILRLSEIIRRREEAVAPWSLLVSATDWTTEISPPSTKSFLWPANLEFSLYSHSISHLPEFCINGQRIKCQCACNSDGHWHIINIYSARFCYSENTPANKFCIVMYVILYIHWEWGLD